MKSKFRNISIHNHNQNSNTNNNNNIFKIVIGITIAISIGYIIIKQTENTNRDTPQILPTEVKAGEGKG